MATQTKSSQKKKIVIIGSSVALGRRATNDQGWAWMLTRDLSKKGHVIVNASLSGAYTQTILDRFHSVVPQENPDIVVISLSLSNEGLHESEQACVSFQENMQKLLNLVKSINAIPILGGLYPNNMYNTRKYNLLKTVQAQHEHLGMPCH